MNPNRAQALLNSQEQFAQMAFEFLRWYFKEMPVRITGGAVKYIFTICEIFSIIFLFKTFFKPWKSITDSYPIRGFNIGMIAQTFTLNMT